MFKKITVLVFLLSLSQYSFASDYLMYLEAQGVGGYSSKNNRAIFYSTKQEDVMQKPSWGFDYIQKFSNDSGDFGSLAVQARISYNQVSDHLEKFEPQLYNFYYKQKTGIADIWAGHNRPAFGISSYFDSHGLLLGTLAMQGYGFDRDWGAGIARDFGWGDIAVSATTGTGMVLNSYGSYFYAGRVSFGVLSQDNYNIGLSYGYGKTIDTMGYVVMNRVPMMFSMAGVDFTHLWNNIENRLEAMYGTNMDKRSLALFWRFGIKFFEEDRLKLEIQPMYIKHGDEKKFIISAGPSFMVINSLSLRGLYEYDNITKNSQYVAQIYFYKKV